MAQYANVFRLEKKANKEDLPRTFEDHVKSVEEFFAFLSNHEQEALAGVDGQAKCQRSRHEHAPYNPSPYIVLESLTSLNNTPMETEHSHLLDRICFESMATLGVECYFKGMRAYHDMPTVANYAYRRARCVKDDMLRIYQKDLWYFTGPNSFYVEEIIKGEPQTSRRDQTSSQQSLKEQVAKKKTQGERL